MSISGSHQGDIRSPKMQGERQSAVGDKRSGSDGEGPMGDRTLDGRRAEDWGGQWEDRGDKWSERYVQGALGDRQKIGEASRRTWETAKEHGLQETPCGIWMPLKSFLMLYYL
ncbi:hypothetical protein BGX38DRAFT_1279396 [Terfezia claveryi]|nr:hypothetical protein BGX38DRAFT_1279396 [Terfezia claveryi]